MLGLLGLEKLELEIRVARGGAALGRCALGGVQEEEDAERRARGDRSRRGRGRGGIDSEFGRRRERHERESGGGVRGEAGVEVGGGARVLTM